MGGWPSEDALAEWLGRSESLEGFWICITDDLVYSGLNGGQFVLGCNSQEG